MRRRPLTLIEMLVCCLILSVAFSAIGLFSYRAYERMRFEKASGKIVALVRQKKLQALVEDKDTKIILPWTGTMLWNGHVVAGVEVTFYSNGSVRPYGELTLQQGDYSCAFTIA